MYKFVVCLGATVVAALLIALVFGVISFSELSVQWAFDPDYFRGANARAGFAVWTAIVLVIYAIFVGVQISDD